MALASIRTGLLIAEASMLTMPSMLYPTAELPHEHMESVIVLKPTTWSQASQIITSCCFPCMGVMQFSL